MGMNGAVPSLPLYAFMAWTGTALSLPFTYVLLSTAAAAATTTPTTTTTATAAAAAAASLGCECGIRETEEMMEMTRERIHSLPPHELATASRCSFLSSLFKFRIISRARSLV
jgi:hypothetical protein